MQDRLPRRCKTTRVRCIRLRLNIYVELWKAQIFDPYEGVKIIPVAAHSARQAHTEGPFGLLCLAPGIFTPLILRIPLFYGFFPRKSAPQDLQQVVWARKRPEAKEFWTVGSSNHQVVRAANATIDDVSSHRSFAIRLVPPIPQIADCRVQGKTTVSMGCAAEVRCKRKSTPAACTCLASPSLYQGFHTGRKM